MNFDDTPQEAAFRGIDFNTIGLLMGAARRRSSA